MALPRLTQLTWECGDARVLATFWQEVLDLPPATGDDDWMTLDWPPVGRLSFHRVDGYEAPVWPGRRGEQQAHLDLLVEDLAEARGSLWGRASHGVVAVGARAATPWVVSTGSTTE